MHFKLFFPLPGLPRQCMALCCVLNSLAWGLNQGDDTTPMKTSPENLTLFHLCYFAIFSIRSTSTETANYPGT